jgi:hypothetical protein
MPPLAALSRRAAIALAALPGLAATSEAKRKRKRKKKGPKCVGLALGARCSTARQCCGTTTNMSCAANEPGNSNGPVCCGTAGVACPGFDDDCCSGFLCVNGVCAVEP